VRWRNALQGVWYWDCRWKQCTRCHELVKRLTLSACGVETSYTLHAVQKHLPSGTWGSRNIVFTNLKPPQHIPRMQFHRVIIVYLTHLSQKSSFPKYTYLLIVCLPTLGMLFYGCKTLLSFLFFPPQHAFPMFGGHVKLQRRVIRSWKA